MVTTEDIAGTLGRQAIATACGVGYTAVSNAVVRGEFPSSWFVTVKGMCDAKGIECPACLFRMKGLKA